MSEGKRYEVRHFKNQPSRVEAWGETEPDKADAVFERIKQELALGEKVELWDNTTDELLREASA